MSRFKLSAGTQVKHGTSSIHLNAILHNGLVAGYAEHADASHDGRARAKPRGIAVGELSAYDKAWTAHSQLINAFLAARPAWSDMAQDFYQHTAAARGRYDLKVTPFSLPVVLNIKLPVDVSLAAEERHLNVDPDPATDEGAWRRWKSGVILQAIPPGWITSFEYPTLLRVEDLLDQKLTGALSEDMFLFLLGARAATDPTVSSTYARQRPLDLPRKARFSQAGIDALLNDRHYTDAENRFVNQCAQQAFYAQHYQEMAAPH